MLTFACSRCPQKLQVKDELAGKQVKCPKCGQLVIVPADRAASVSQSASQSVPAPVASSSTSPPASPDVTHSSANPLEATSGGAPAVPAEDYDFLTPPQAADELGRLGPYRVLKVLGAGGMGAQCAATGWASAAATSSRRRRPPQRCGRTTANTSSPDP